MMERVQGRRLKDSNCFGVPIAPSFSMDLAKALIFLLLSFWASCLRLSKYQQHYWCIAYSRLQRWGNWRLLLRKQHSWSCQNYCVWVDRTKLKWDIESLVAAEIFAEGLTYIPAIGSLTLGADISEHLAHAVFDHLFLGLLHLLQSANEHLEHPTAAWSGLRSLLELGTPLLYLDLVNSHVIDHSLNDSPGWGRGYLMSKSPADSPSDSESPLLSLEASSSCIGSGSSYSTGLSSGISVMFSRSWSLSWELKWGEWLNCRGDRKVELKELKRPRPGWKGEHWIICGVRAVKKDEGCCLLGSSKFLSYG